MVNIMGNETNMSSNVSDVYHGVDYNRHLRIGSLGVLFVFSVVGNCAVFAWMWFNRRAKARIHTFMVHLCTADLLVAFLALLSHFIVELTYDRWYIGEVGCRLFKTVQSATLFASSNMVVAIAIDRFHSVIYPFKQRKNVYTILVPAWVIAGVLSLPQVFVWETRENSKGVIGCHTSLKKTWQKQAYLTWASLVMFFIPFIIITICYLRIILRLWEKRNTVLPGKSERRRKAKMKTLRMTFVIISFFVLCGLPYFALDMYRFYGNARRIDPYAYAVLAIFSVSHCAVNPFIFLAFNARTQNSSNKYQENSTVTTTPTRTSL
ncbi:vasopressin V1b receptor-like [Ptychodera flava]|uniref:vasopressin V1b receptor-like n=1 Tax=Ptychodera flava TaxID=63121 RepID=UPI00396A9446